MTKPPVTGFSKQQENARLSSSKTGPAKALYCLLFGLLISAATGALAVNEESLGGALRNDAERTLNRPALPEVSPKPALEKPAAPALTGDTVVVQRFQFTGNILLPESVLARAVAPYVGRPIDFAELQNAASVAALAYRERGYVATVGIPRQEIADGVITLKVTEAKYSGASLDPASTGRIQSELILSRIDRAMKVEKAVNVNVLDRQLLLLNDMPGASVRAGLAPGDADGETRVVVQSEHRPLITGSVSFDANGSISTGRDRTSIDIAINSPKGKGEQITASAMSSEGMTYGRVGLSFPVGSNGARVGLSGSALDYSVIGGPNVLSNLRGSSTSAGIDLSYPAIRSQQANLYLTSGLVTKRFDNYSTGIRSRLYETNAASFSASGNWLDRWFGGAGNQASAMMTVGEMSFQDDMNKLSDGLAARTQGNYTKFNLNLSRNQSLPDGWSIVVTFAGQRASKNLDSSERFYLGGPTGVRAYPVSEGGGSEGELWQAELRKRLPQGLELRLFRDYGRVRQSAVAFVGQPTPEVLTYQGLGAALVWQGPRGLTLSAAWAKRIGSNPNPHINPEQKKTDQDGTLVRDRVWVTATLPF